MPKKNKGAQEGRPAAPEGASWDTHEAIWNAKSLQRVVEKLERTRPESPESDLLLFNGRALAGPILLSLATELALKALLCLERKKAPPRIHGLLKLFEQLEPDTQEMLEAMMRKVSAFPISAAVPSIQNLNPHLQEMFGVRMHPLRYILREHRDANMHWRFLHEQQWESLRDIGNQPRTDGDNQRLRQEVGRSTRRASRLRPR